MATEQNTLTLQQIKDFQSEWMKHVSPLSSDPMFRENRLTFQFGGILS